MSGGIRAWNGLVSRAEVDQGMYLIEGDESPEEVIALAYGLEAATHRFYQDLTDRTTDTDLKNAFGGLAEDEIQHKDRLWERYKTVTGGRETREAFETGIVAKTLEDGKTADQILAKHPHWVEQPRDAFELVMSLETDSFDLYLRLGQKSSHEETGAIFYDLAQVEKEHLQKLGALFRQTVHPRS
jgi:rubrerythrin